MGAPPRLAAAAVVALLAACARADTWVSVKADGTGDFTSLQAALDALNPAANASVLGHVYVALQGAFWERVNVYSNFSGGVTITGYGDSPTDNLIAFNVSGAAGPGTFGSWTFKSDAPNVTLVNVAVANSADGYDHKLAGQSVALHLTSEYFACWNCSLLGAQDTLYTGDVRSRSYFYNTFINGSCDALFGGSASVFDRAHIVMSFTITAQRGNGSTSYLIQDSLVEVPEGDALLLGACARARAQRALPRPCAVRTCPHGIEGHRHLDLQFAPPPAPPPLLLTRTTGRPWGANASVVFKNTVLGSGVEKGGWDDWGRNCTDKHSAWCGGVFFAEYNSTGPGSDPTSRPWWTYQLSAAEAAQWTPAAVLGGWVPAPPVSAAERPAMRRFLTSSTG